MCILALLLVTSSYGQSRLDLKLSRDAIITGAGFTLIGTGFLLAHQNEGRPTPMIDIADVPAIDRVALRMWSPTAHRTSNVVFGVSAALALAGSIVNQQGERPLMPLAISTESMLLTAGLTNTVKEWVRRPRPYMYNDDVPLSEQDARRDFVSFWSGHTANLAACTFSVAYMVQESDATPGVKTASWIAASVLPASVAFLRVRAGRHFPTDVFMGYVIGAGVGILVPYFHRVEQNTER